MDETYDVFEYYAEKRAALEAWEKYLIELKTATATASEVAQQAA